MAIIPVLVGMKRAGGGSPPPPPGDLLNEGFDNITTLTGDGWFRVIKTTAPGTSPDWFQGNAPTFPAFDGASNAYIGANFNAGAGNTTISLWLLTPILSLDDGVQLSYYTRTSDHDFADRLQVRMSLNGASADVGGSATSVGDFTTLLRDINPTYDNTSYPTTFTQFIETLSGIGGPTNGRLAFRYFVESGGPSGDNSNYIGIDRVVVTPP